ncbi:MAG: type I pullulanase [Treponema sp.]|jgi:pullulanase|nr:type I pullulanase [Treponema sp.]
MPRWLIFLLFIISCSNPEPSLIVHYHRYSGDYENWNVWIWPKDPPGNGYAFPFDSLKPSADGFVTARIFYPVNTDINEFGIIIRQSVSGNNWAQKDTNNDRFTKDKEIWIVQGDPVIYTAKPDISHPPILFAAAGSPNTILAALPFEPLDWSVFAVYQNETRLNGSSQKYTEDDNIVLITLNENITDPSKLYIVKDDSGTFTQRNVIMREILNDFYYYGNDLGLTFSVTQSSFKVWAPTAVSVYTALYDDAGTYNSAGLVTNHETGNLHLMLKDSATGVWSLVLQGNLEGKFYLYRVEFADGTANWAADPYAKAVSANGQRMAVVDLAKTNPALWREKPKPAFNAGSWQDAVIYELHVRDFSINENSGMIHKGKYLAFTERGTTTRNGTPTGIDHLKLLGITHVHLLPVYDFASINELAAEPLYNWGYDPIHYNVPEGSYSTDPLNPSTRIIEFKKMVQALHDAGIRVIMDVVYNHTFHTGGWPFDALVPKYYYRTTNTGVYANGSGCGNEVASERPMVRKFIIDSLKHWVNEYNIDGFRFDLMGLIDTPTMLEATKELRRLDPSLIIYGEPWQAGGSILPENLQTLKGSQRRLDFAVFNDHFRTAIKGGSDCYSQGFVTGQPNMEEGIVLGIMGAIHDFTDQANESVNYVTAHDNLNLWDKMAFSHGEDNLALTPYRFLEGKNDLFDSDVVRSTLLANGIVFTSQGIPFFQAGDEFLRTKFGDYNSYISPDNINMIRWENADRFGEIISYYAGLIRLRKAIPAFRQTLKEDIDKTMEILYAQDMGVSFILKDNVFVAYNGGSQPKTFTLPPGTWHQVVNYRYAGTETLGEFSGQITLPRISMTVLLGD